MKLKINSYFLDGSGQRFFGEGPCKLLSGIKEHGSLRAAAAEMGMAYAKAFTIMKRAEQTLGTPLTRRSIGGRGGGGSELTPEGESLLKRYIAYRTELFAAGDALFKKHFPEFAAPTVGAVILAAGKGVRFGGGKQLHPFLGEPLCSHVVKTLPQSLLENTVAVVSDREVEEVYQSLGVRTVFYPGGPKSESVKQGLSEFLAADGCIFLPADQPLLMAESVQKLLSAFSAEPECVWRLSFDGKAGAPVVFPKKLYPDLLALSGERGGMAAVPEGFPVKYVAAGSALELQDADTPETLLRLESAQS